MNKIKSLQSLLLELKDCAPDDYRKLCRDMDLNASEFSELAFWSKQAYTRNCVVKTDKYELILLCWEPGQVTPIHNHNNQECWVYTVEGELEEDLFEMDDQGLPGKIRHSNYETGSKSYMVDQMGYHKLHNNSKNRAMSLHLYVGPISKCDVYNESEKVVVSKDLFYDSVEGKLLYPNPAVV